MTYSHPTRRITLPYMQTSGALHGRYTELGAIVLSKDGGSRNFIARVAWFWHRPPPMEEIPMARAKLDRIDRRILSDLQSDGRMTNVELAERAGISAPPCLRRVRALERAGIIKGYHAELSPEALGYSVSVFALVGLNSPAEIDLKAFEELIAKWDEVRECHMLAGEADFLLKIVAETWDEY